MKRKNIVFLMTDQHRHDALGVVNPMIKTPVLDKLAKRGTRYTQGICNCPMCVPSRYSLMTGLYPFQTGIRHNTNMCTNDEMMEAPTLAERLRDAGYKTGGFGKTHWYIGKYFGKDVEVEQSARGFDVRAIRASGDDGTDEDGAVYWGNMD